MNTEFDIYSVKTVVFEHGERDPFGFDDFAEKLGAEYLPFSGSVRKPAYLLFVRYVNWLLKEKRIPFKNQKEKNEIKVRLEKLLVYCWKKAESNNELRGAAIIGNSFDIKDIDPFSGKGWVKQNCYKIYTENNFKPQNTLQYYLKKIGEKQVGLLKDFLSLNEVRIKKKEYLDGLRKKLNKSDSLFSNHLLNGQLKQKFKNELKENLERKNKSEYFKHVEHFFLHNFNEDVFWKKTLDNDKLPFKGLNEWFGKFVDSVDSDINDKDSNKLWNIADNAFDSIPEKIRSKYQLEKRPQKPRIWFEYNNGKYSLIEKSKKNNSLWEIYRNRQGEEKETRYFFNYRHYAFLQLLKELAGK